MLKTIKIITVLEVSEHCHNGHMFRIKFIKAPDEPEIDSYIRTNLLKSILF